MDVEENLKPIRLFCLAVALAAMLTVPVQAQESASAQEKSLGGTVPPGVDGVSLTDASQNHILQNQDPAQTTRPGGKSSQPDATTREAGPVIPSGPDEQYGKQNKRILWVVPNYRAVSANQHLPPLDFKGELWLATQDTFDYSDFIFVGGLAGIDMAGGSQPTFGQGADGYGKYYWHVFVDGAIENYMTEAFVPAATKEDPRYYTLGKGGFVKRTGYAVSRLFITRTNLGGSTFNLSEIVGAGAAAGIGNAYYPAESNPWVKTYQRWGTQVGLDGVFNVLKEFWPDINQVVFHGKY